MQHREQFAENLVHRRPGGNVEEDDAPLAQQRGQRRRPLHPAQTLVDQILRRAAAAATGHRESQLQGMAHQIAADAAQADDGEVGQHAGALLRLSTVSHV